MGCSIRLATASSSLSPNRHNRVCVCDCYKITNIETSSRKAETLHTQSSWRMGSWVTLPTLEGQKLASWPVRRSGEHRPHPTYLYAASNAVVFLYHVPWQFVYDHKLSHSPLVRTKLWISIGHSFGSVWQSRALRSHMTVSGLNAGGINLLPKRYTDVATDLFYVRANCTREEMFIFKCDICREFSGMPLFVTVHLIDLI